MAVKGELKIQNHNQKYKVLECEFELARGLSKEDVFAGGLFGGIVKLTIVTPSKGVFFPNWMFKHERHSGGIELKINTSESKTNSHTIEFKHAELTNYYEYYNYNNKNMATTRITMNCYMMAIFDNNYTEGSGYNFGTKRFLHEVEDGFGINQSWDDPTADALFDVTQKFMNEK